MAEIIPNGTRREVGGRPSVYYDGYWIKLYVLRALSGESGGRLPGGLRAPDPQALTPEILNKMSKNSEIVGQALPAEQVRAEGAHSAHQGSRCATT